MTLNRPKALNGLNAALIAELDEVLRLIDANENIGAVVITGLDGHFAGEPFALHCRCLAWCRRY